MKYTETVAVLVLLLGSATACAQGEVDSRVGLYQVDPESSDILILVRRAGFLKQFGHNHVISVGELDGTVFLRPDDENSSLSLTIPVRELIVDDPLLRSRQGEEFLSQPSETDIAGTRRNMLSDRVLNADEYPVIRVIGEGLLSDTPEIALGLSIEFLGQVVELSIPVRLQMDGDNLEATGAFRITHDDLGIQPFSTLLGTLRVANELDFEYRVSAVAVR